MAGLRHLWVGLTMRGFILTGLTCGRKVLKIRHEQEQRLSGRRLRQVENRLREREVQLYLARQQNQRLQAELATSRAMLAMEQSRAPGTASVWLASRR